MEETTRAGAEPAQSVSSAMPAGEAKARHMRVVKKIEFVGAVERALGRALARNLPRAEAGVVRSVQADVRAEILGLLRRRGRPVRGMTKAAFLEQLEVSKDRLLTERARVEQELEGLRERVAELKRGGASVEEIDKRVRALFDSSPLARRVSTRLGKQVVAFGKAAVLAELEHMGARPGASSEAELLERRISKLTGEMSRMEDALHKLAKMKDVDAGEASIYRTVQGLAQIDALFEQKQELLRDIFQSNVRLKDQILG